MYNHILTYGHLAPCYAPGRVFRYIISPDSCKTRNYSLEARAPMIDTNPDNKHIMNLPARITAAEPEIRIMATPARAWLVDTWNIVSV